MKNIFIKLLISLSVIGIIILLMMINTKLLIHLNWIKTDFLLLDKIAVMISGLAFALGSISVVIYYNKGFGSVVLKVAFALLDGFHVYIYNNSHVEDLAYWVSPIFAVQTVLILFFIGNVVHGIFNEETDTIDYEAQIKILESELKKQADVIYEYDEVYSTASNLSEKLQSQLQAQLGLNEKLETDNNKLESDINAIEINAVLYVDTISALNEQVNKFEPVYNIEMCRRIDSKKSNSLSETEIEFYKKVKNCLPKKMRTDGIKEK